MIVAAAVAFVLLGVLIGARGMRRLGETVRGPWRPGAALFGILLVFVALAALSRGAWWEAGLLGLAAAACLGAARGRGGAASTREPAASPGMSRRDAAELLGVGEGATPAEAEAAFRRLALRLHPDQGGTAGLLARLQEARAAFRR